MLEHYLLLDGTEIVNHARLQAYLDTGVSLTTMDIGACRCPSFTADLVGDQPYTTPDADPAPWYDPHVPASAEFAGLLVLTVEGLDDRPTIRRTTGRVTGGAALGPVRDQPRTITVTGVLLGASCCGVAYGLRWLGQALQGCGQRGCTGDDLTFYDCCPDDPDPELEEFQRRHRRTMRRTVLTEGPRVVARDGDGCRGGCTADVLTVEFTLTAATPWAWADPQDVVDTPVPNDDGTDCIEWCVHGGEPDCGEPCRLATCVDPAAACADPTCTTPTPPTVPLPATCYCQAVAVNRDCYELDMADLPAWFEAAPIITISAGSQDLRRVTVTFYTRTVDHSGLSCDEIAQVERCNPHAVYHAGYVPAGGTLTFDGQVRQATVACGGVVEQSPDAWGRDGSPPLWALLGCTDEYCVCIEADAIFTPAVDATVQIALSGREQS